MKPIPSFSRDIDNQRAAAYSKLGQHAKAARTARSGAPPATDQRSSLARQGASGRVVGILGRRYPTTRLQS